MTLLKAESFMFMSGAQVKRKWTQYTSGSDPSAQSGRFGGSSAAMRFGNSGVRFGLDGDPQTVIAGGAFKFVNYATGSAVMWGQAEGAALWAISTDSSGHLRAHIGNANTTPVAISSNTLNTATWYYIEVKHKTDNSTGTFEVRVNGTSTGWINLSSQDTQVGAFAYTDLLGYGAEISGNGNSVDITDMYICDTGGSTNNDFLGDIRVEAILPSGAGNYTEFTDLVGAANHAAAVDDSSSQDDDTTYVGSSTTGHRDTFAMGNITPSTGSILGVALNATARKDDAGTRLLKLMARLSSTDSESSTESLGTDYAGVQRIMETKPGGGAWSITDVNNAEFGVRIG